MATAILSNPCIRCGKQRITSKTWTEKVDTYFGKSVITHTETVCPDKDCQKIVAQGLAKEKERADSLKHDREERMKLAQKNRRKN